MKSKTSDIHKKEIIILRFLVHLIFNLIYDIKNNISTLTPMNLEEDSNLSSRDISHCKRYECCHYLNLRRAFRYLPKDLKNYSFIDIGSGKGKALCYALDYPFKNIKGVEISSKLHSIAIKNLIKSSINKKHPPFSVELKDVLDFIPPENSCIYFLYNPINGPTLRKFLGLHKKNNDFYIYINPIYDYIFQMNGFRKIVEHKRKNNNDTIYIYSI